MTGPTPPGADVAVPVETLLGADSDRFEALLAGEQPGPVAVVGPPYGGRERLLDAAADRLAATRVRIDPGDDAAAAVEAVADGPAVVADCHHLYRREVGGFDRLSPLLDALAETREPVVTGWNDTAWAYLSAVLDADRSVDAVLGLDGLSAEELASALSAVAATRTFRRADPGAGVVDLARYSVAWRGRELSIPVPRPSLSALRSAEAETPEAAVFERLTALSAGNPGVAAALLARADGTVAPTDLDPAGAGRSFDDPELFCLRALLGGERVDRADLRAVAGGETARIVGQFARDGIVTTDGESVTLDPAAVPTAAAAVGRRGLL